MIFRGVCSCNCGRDFLWKLHARLDYVLLVVATLDKPSTRLEIHGTVHRQVAIGYIVTSVICQVASAGQFARNSFRFPLDWPAIYDCVNLTIASLVESSAIIPRSRSWCTTRSRYDSGYYESRSRSKVSSVLPLDVIAMTMIRKRVWHIGRISRDLSLKFK